MKLARGGLRPSRRATRAAEAVVERIIGTYLKPGVINLAPGSVHWAPPAELLQRCPSDEGSNHGYDACHGDAGLISSLRSKLERENELNMSNREVMVTPGANHAYATALLAVCDPGDQVVLFAPYYFSHLLAIQLLGLTPVVLPCNAATGAPEVSALQTALSQPGARIRAVTLVNPSNPSGAVSDPERTSELMRACAEGGAWLVSDEAYEHFVHGGRDAATAGDGRGEGGAPHPTNFASAGGARCEPSMADGVISLHTFSKSYGLAGWRVGYLSYPASLDSAMLKIQDTLPTHASIYSQRVARAALEELGEAWVRAQVATLTPAREQLWRSVAPLYEHAAQVARANEAFSPSMEAPASAPCHQLPTMQPAGAFYYMLPLPAGLEEEEAIAILSRRHGLLVLPGSAFGLPGTLRLSYGKIGAEVAEMAASRLADAACDLLERAG